MKYPNDWKIKDTLQSDKTKEANNNSLVLYKGSDITSSPQLSFIINDGGHGLPSPEIKYDIEYTDKLSISNRKLNTSSEMGTLTKGTVYFYNNSSSTITLKNNVYFISGQDIASSEDEGTIKDILSSFSLK